MRPGGWLSGPRSAGGGGGRAQVDGGWGVCVSTSFVSLSSWGAASLWAGREEMTLVSELTAEWSSVRVSLLLVFASE